ncbi:MAG TPA: hypothetical protein VNN08_20215 [Thermoanaerobaculia bacterium]|nr:hypothetical protein [Thermoanaerobaculia bacterium]
MRIIAIALLLATACASTTAPPPAPAETRPTTPGSIPIAPRGISCNSAVVIDAATEREGIAKERAWIAENYPGAKEVSQALIQCNDKAADQVDIETANAQKRSVYFDISKWFGKH